MKMVDQLIHMAGCSRIRTTKNNSSGSNNLSRNSVVKTQQFTKYTMK